MFRVVYVLLCLEKEAEEIVLDGEGKSVLKETISLYTERSTDLPGFRGYRG